MGNPECMDSADVSDAMISRWNSRNQVVPLPAVGDGEGDGNFGVLNIGTGNQDAQTEVEQIPGGNQSRKGSLIAGSVECPSSGSETTCG